jgi:hypothetical protein
LFLKEKKGKKGKALCRVLIIFKDNNNNKKRNYKE